MKTNEELTASLGTDPNAEKQLVEQNMGLVYKAAGKFSGRGVETEDLIQIGAIGLIKAAKNFDTSFNVKFSTYAVPVIIGEIRRFIRDDNPIKISRSLKELSVKVRTAYETLSKRHGREPVISELAAECCVTVEEAAEALNASSPVTSIYAGEDDDSFSAEQKLTVGDCTDKINDRIALTEALKQLSPNERRVIVLRYFKDYTQTHTAKILGVSQVQISRTEKKAIEKIRSLSVL